uniref:Mucin-3A n=1 Tax=Callorhinus ursinus TaxID=34884 RepID=A0A3Q7PW41_CALUR|nr:mucin-3A [Callorhinus ursinus]
MQGLCHCPLGFSGDHCELQEIRCQNGGKWDGLTCHCPSTFSGSRCEFVVGQVDLDTVDAEVGMEVSVDQEFSPDLNDSTSAAYKDFSDTFPDQMQKIYQNVQGFKDVEILSLRSGSIVVDYLVLLEFPFSPQLETEYEKMKSILKEELQNVSHNGDSCQHNQTLCFKPDSIKVNNNTRKELTLEAICRRATAKGYEDFYFPLVEENRLPASPNALWAWTAPSTVTRASTLWRGAVLLAGETQRTRGSPAHSPPGLPAGRSPRPRPSTHGGAPPTCQHPRGPCARVDPAGKVVRFCDL